MRSGIKVKMASKQSTLLLIIFFSLLLVSSATEILYPEGGKLPGKRDSVAHISTIHSGHGGGGEGGSVGGGTGSSGEGSHGDTTSGSREPDGAGAANMNHHRRGASSRVQCSVFLTWVVAISVAQFLSPI